MDRGMRENQSAKSCIEGVHGEAIEVAKNGNMPGMVHDRDGQMVQRSILTKCGQKIVFDTVVKMLHAMMSK